MCLWPQQVAPLTMWLMRTCVNHTRMPVLWGSISKPRINPNNTGTNIGMNNLTVSTSFQLRLVGKTSFSSKACVCAPDITPSTTLWPHTVASVRLREPLRNPSLKDWGAQAIPSRQCNSLPDIVKIFHVLAPLLPWG